jgi:hypothetical protein
VAFAAPNLELRFPAGTRPALRRPATIFFLPLTISRNGGLPAPEEERTADGVAKRSAGSLFRGHFHVFGTRQMETKPTSFRELVDSLRSAGACPDVLLELQEFELAMQEVWQRIAAVETLTERIADELTLAGQRGQTLNLPALVSSTRQAAGSTSQILAAFGQICRAIRTWEICAPLAVSAISTPIPSAFLSSTKSTS